MSRPPEFPPDYFPLLADGAPVMVWMSGPDMGCFYFNRAWLDFVGRTREQEVGNGWAEGVHPEDLERCVNHYVACFQSRVPFAMSYRLRHHSGEYRWILDRGAPHYRPDGAFLGYFGGCAELAESSAPARHAALGDSLIRMRVFARNLAQDEAMRIRVDREDEPLELAVRRLVVAHHSDRSAIEYAAAEIKQLAADMLTYGRLPRGACWPERPSAA